ncbi:hypothetical protein EZI54_22670 [Marinobacter halodurans]|uniref:Lipoprotein n=1 Tax=Marinobacter halodurans TaxID=2528979 RepID=A0ABY1ZDP3_9GAMM|nr:hypothetical protein [Marinobacter halodurans]TBW47492.1 hypothetical protein EZI54_22670 [Marinobacter halodurans]
MKEIKLIILFLIFVMMAACASNSKDDESYSACYSEYTRIGEERLVKNRVYTDMLLGVIGKIQLKRGVSFNEAVSVYKRFDGNAETRAIDRKISEIDEKSREFNELVESGSDLYACEQRLELEQERYMLGILKFDAIGRSF